MKVNASKNIECVLTADRWQIRYEKKNKKVHIAIRTH